MVRCGKCPGCLCKDNCGVCRFCRERGAKKGCKKSCIDKACRLDERYPSLVNLEKRRPEPRAFGPKESARDPNCKCIGCLAMQDCGQCLYCLDKDKETGSGRRHQRCLMRQCRKNPRLPSMERSSARYLGEAGPSGIQRRSNRLRTELQSCNKEARLSAVLANDRDEGLQVFDAGLKGRGVRTTRPFIHGEPVCEYVGEILAQAEAADLHTKYHLEGKGCYIYLFEFEGKSLCIDGTAENGRLGRLINHGKKAANLIPRVLRHQGEIRFVFFAKRDLALGEEVLYDYNERDPAVIRENPWLAI